MYNYPLVPATKMSDITLYQLRRKLARFYALPDFLSLFGGYGPSPLSTMDYRAFVSIVTALFIILYLCKIKNGRIHRTAL